MARQNSCSLSLLSLDEGTLLEVFVRLGVADLANTASSCTAFANMCRSEWLWRQLSALRGIRILDPPGYGWRSMYIALCRVEVAGWSPLALIELKRLCKLFQGFSIPAGHNLVCIEQDLSCLMDLSENSPAAMASAEGAGSSAGAEGACRVVHSGHGLGTFRFAGERWACQLASYLSEDEQLPTLSVRISRIESTVAKCESSRWFHILSAQSHLILPEQESIGPISNGIVALGKVPAGIQMHVDIPEVRQRSGAFPCSTWEHADEVSVSGGIHRDIADQLISHAQSLRLACEASSSAIPESDFSATPQGGVRGDGRDASEKEVERGRPVAAPARAAREVQYPVTSQAPLPPCVTKASNVILINAKAIAGKEPRGEDCAVDAKSRMQPRLFPTNIRQPSLLVYTLPSSCRQALYCFEVIWDARLRTNGGKESQRARR